MTDESLEPPPLLRERSSPQINKLAKALSCLTSPFFCCICPVQVYTGYEVIVSRWGKPIQTLTEPGSYCFNQCGLDTIEVWKGGFTERLEKIIVNDCNGNPLLVTARYSYKLSDTLEGTFNFQHRARMVNLLAISTLLKVSGNYPYESFDGKPCLRLNSSVINKELKATLNNMIKDFSLRAGSFTIISIGIEEKMQKLLLAKQEAQAYITGRKEIAESAFKIAQETLSSLNAQNIQLSEKERNALIINLTFMICDPAKPKLNFYEL